MGQAPSLTLEEQIRHFSKYTDALFASNHWQGFEIDSSLQRFSGLNSNQELTSYRDRVLYADGVERAASVVERLGSELGGLVAVPNAVGLGALVIAIILETVAKSLSKQTLGTERMIERVFATEKAREVRDLMEDYLKQLATNLGNREVQLALTRQRESQLSTQLTRLKNSMQVDGHMSTRALRQWVNGAAFHTQMLIHEARLGGAAGSKAQRAAGIYQNQLDRLLEKYREYMDAAIGVYGHRPSFYLNDCCVSYAESPNPNSNSACVSVHYGQSTCVSEETVVNVMFTKPPITWAETYFSDLQRDVPTLVSQNSPFRL